MLQVPVSPGTAFTVVHGGESVKVSRNAEKGDGAAKRLVFGAVDNAVFVFGDRLSVDDTISVGDGVWSCHRRCVERHVHLL